MVFWDDVIDPRQPKSVISITPEIVSSGDTATIIGVGFNDTTQIVFSSDADQSGVNVVQTIVEVVSSTEITITVVAGALPAGTVYVFPGGNITVVLILTPDDFTSSNLLLWWDNSETDGGYVFSDAAGTLAIADGEFIRRINSRHAGSVAGAPVGLSESDATRPRWNSGVQNGHGAMEPSIGPGGAIVGCVSVAGAWAGSPDPKTYIAVVEVPSGSTFAQWFCGPTQSIGYNIGLSTNANGFVSEVQVMRTNPTPLNYTARGTAGSWSLLAGNWFMFTFTSYADPDPEFLFNNQEETPAWAITPGSWVDETQSSLRFGCGNANLFTAKLNEWKAACGELLLYDGPLSSSDLSGLYLYFQNKWSTSGDPP